ncbi:MAG: tetratricopeptide repeat protein [Spirochaetaceae bacterium]|jgi:tetratricopeptide (TPR) repeat protein|nr:tetratricopeptide repeat protein [Spirochaetaceae bacterium]
MKRSAALCIILLITLAGVFAQGAPLSADDWYERGEDALLAGDWYGAVEAFLDALELNSAHAGANAALAESYYELGEYDMALNWVRKARVLSRGSSSLANLEALILITQHKLQDARTILNEILQREPYNREALFTAAELDIAEGRAGGALARFREAAGRFPGDRRVLVSLALTQSALGDAAGAEATIQRALQTNPGDAIVYYYAAYLAGKQGRLADAASYAQTSLQIEANYRPALRLLAQLHYRMGNYPEAISYTDTLIGLNANDDEAQYIKGMALLKQNDAAGIAVLNTALTINNDDEFSRVMLEDAALSGSIPVDEALRTSLAAWHFSRAKDFQSRNLSDQALFEYRRGLALKPDAAERLQYANLLKGKGLQYAYLSQLGMLKTQDTAIKDAIETTKYQSQETLANTTGIDTSNYPVRHWQLAIYALQDDANMAHVDAGLVTTAYVKSILTTVPGEARNIEVLGGSKQLFAAQEKSFSRAFANARLSGVDYFLIIKLEEQDRELQLSGSLYTAHSGALAQSFSIYRSGLDKLRNACIALTSQLRACLPLRGALVQRSGAVGIIDKGSADGIKADQVFNVYKKNGALLLDEGIGIKNEAEAIGTFTVTTVDEQIAQGKIVRNGFYDLIQAGDDCIIQNPKPEETGASATDTSTANTATSTGATSTGNAAAGTGTNAVLPIEANRELRQLLQSLN